LSLIPSIIRKVFKALIKPARWVDEMNAVVTREAFAWLVGPCEVVPRDRDGVYASVKLKKCRYLEQSGPCTASCTNFCKIPTQRFFKEAFGVDARLDPNHEDGSCMMTFGVAPDVDDRAFAAPCYATCGKAKCDENKSPCHRLGPPP
jgi:beta-carotene isomerase